MKLQAIFWDYPRFTDENYLIQFLKSNRDEKKYLWFLQRFLEYGRVVDTLKIFTIEEITSYLKKLKLTDYSLKKWKRIIEVYHTDQGR
jgi:hypothetical protein